jgi:hypothetical protein
MFILTEYLNCAIISLQKGKMIPIYTPLYAMTVLYDVTFVQVSEQIQQGDGRGSYTFVCYESRQPSKSSVVFAFPNFKVAD